MKKIIFILILSQFTACIPHRIYKEFDEFENLRKFKISQIYNAKKDFTGTRQIKINYYKTISQNGEIDISARLIAYSTAEDGKLNEHLDIRIGNEIYTTDFYNYQSNYDLYPDVDISVNNDDDDNDPYEISHSNSENIRHLADFNLSQTLVEHILNTELLSMRFYIGKEAYTLRFSKFELKQLKKFLLVQ
ncbi:MAG: hypothetical protein L3J74_00960 [Bacteroidales bacterium]|nr:hypothetical protein [Bacteroidales bacterium]